MKNALVFLSFLMILQGCSPDTNSNQNCGNGVIDTGETCDGTSLGDSSCMEQGFYGGDLKCTASCKYDLSACELFGSCGDGVINPTYEECENGDLGNTTCETLGYLGGTLRCSDDCRFDVSDCDGAEDCGDGTIQWQYEDCEGNDLNGATCETVGFHGLGLSCTENCRFNITDCIDNGRCGDFIIQDEYEECDGIQLNSATCVSLGYYDGMLKCSDDCSYDVTDCENYGRCGDNTKQASFEECDGSDIGMATCEDMGFYPGLPLCTDDCTFDSASCGQCGDNMVQTAYEECDGSAQGTGTCRDFGYFGGTVSGCDSSCHALGCSSLIQIDAGQYHTCGVDQLGYVYCWGRNNAGQLGNDSTEDSQIPVKVQGLDSIVMVSCGNEHSCALRTDGTVRCWGNGDDGRLGTGNTSSSLTPLVSVISSVSYIDAGEAHTCAVKNDGSVYCWGNNANGQLGDSSNTDRSTPVKAANYVGGAKVACGASHTCAIQVGGVMWCWGSNYNGQYGNDSTEQHFYPVHVTTIDSLTHITAGSNHTCGIKTDGTAWCWGEGSDGQIGDGFSLQRLTPRQVKNISGLSNIGAGANHTCAVESGGITWCWGNGGNGRLGNDLTNDAEEPVSAVGMNSSLMITGGTTHTCIINTDGFSWCWGYNIFGQLGDNSSTQRTLPVMTASPL
ncbi:MAG: hypothetical protein JXR95_10535 [Deltaproteobacteria bacterium]|nr:hypothetical protein [Deltaproteobacteria bacterium]